MIDLIGNLPPKIRQKLVHKHVDSGELVVTKGEPADKIYILLKGSVRAINEFTNGQRYSFGRIDPPDFIGDLEFLAEAPFYATNIEARVPCTLVSMKVETLWEWIDFDPSLLRRLARDLAQKMYPTSNNSGIVKFLSSEQNLHLYLMQTYEAAYESKSTPENPLKINATRQRIADHIGMSIKTVNRCIKKLKENDLVNIKRGKLFLSTDQYIKLLELQQHA
jgi:CRP/FNR family transcriptional regulator, cyclic AMP receptor protein